MPLAWIHSENLALFFKGGRHLGASVAALKIMMAVLLKAENKPATSATKTQGSASLTYDELMEMTGLSRSMIAAGIKRLTAIDLLTVAKEGRGRKNRYFVLDYMVGAWGKLPFKQVAGLGSRNRIGLLHDISCKRSSDLEALKLYFLLCASRSGASPYAMIGYERIQDVTGILKTRIRRAISILIEHDLVRVDHEKSPDGAKTNTPNKYYIRGL